MNLIIEDKLDKITEILNNKPKNCWMSLREATRYTSLSPSTLRRLVSNNLLQCSKKTGKLLFKKSWIDNFLES